MRRGIGSESAPVFTRPPVGHMKILHYYVAVCPGLATVMPPNSAEGEILTIKQVADYLKVTERTIYRLAAAKKIPAFKVGGTWRFSRADIDNWIRQQSAQALDGDSEEHGVSGRG